MIFEQKIWHHQFSLFESCVQPYLFGIAPLVCSACESGEASFGLFFFLFSTVCCDSCWLGGDSPTKVIAACSRATRWAEAKQSPFRSFRLVRRVFVQGIERNSKRSFAVVSRCVLFDCFWFETVMWSFWISKGCKRSAKRRFSKSQALHLFLEPNQARGWGKSIHVRMCTWHGFYTVFTQCFAMLLWHGLYLVPGTGTAQIPRNAIMCSTLLRAAPAVLPSKLKLASEWSPGELKSDSWQMMMESLMEVWNHGYPDFFFVKNKKSGVPGTDWFAVFFCFWFKVLRCHVVFTIFDVVGFRGGHVKGSETWHHRLQCVSLDVFSWKGKAGKDG